MVIFKALYVMQELNIYVSFLIQIFTYHTVTFYLIFQIIKIDYYFDRETTIIHFKFTLYVYFIEFYFNDPFIP
jgi:hypothetical protein